MERVFRKISPKECPMCGKFSIIAYNKNDKIVRYEIGDKDLRKLNINTLYCTNCKQDFFPYWMHGVPYPSTENNIIDFLDGYAYYKSIDP